MTTLVLNSAANVDDSQFPALTNGAAAPVTIQIGVDAAGQRVQLGANAKAAGVTEVLYQPTSGAVAANGATIDVQQFQGPISLVGSGANNTFLMTQAELGQNTVNGGSAPGNNVIGFGGSVSITDGIFAQGHISNIGALQLFSGNASQTIILGTAAVAEGINGIYTDNANNTVVDLSGMVGTSGITVRSGSQASIVGSPGNDHYRFFFGDLNSSDTIHGHAGSTNTVELRDEGHIDDVDFTNMTNIQVAALTFDHSGQAVTLGAMAQAAGVRTVEFVVGNSLPIHGYLADVTAMTVGVTIHGSANNDTMLGNGDGDQFIIGANSSDSITGGSPDTAVFANARSAYTISKSNGVVTVFQNVHSIDTIVGVGTLQFTDQSVATSSISDASGNPPPSSNPGVNGGLIGTAADDTLSGTGTGEVLLSGEGNDVITVGNGNELIVAGTMSSTASSAENDTVTAGNGNNIIFGGAGSGSITVGDGNNLIAVHSPLLSTFGNTTVHLGNGPDTVFAVGGNDTIFGGGGTDFIHGGSGAVSIQAGAGLSLIVGGQGASTITGGSGMEALFGVNGHDLITGGTGGDTIIGTGSDTIHAGAGPDAVVLNPGSETVITDLGAFAVRISLGGFTAANQTTNIQIGAGHDTLILNAKAGFAGDGYAVSGYKPGIDHFQLVGLAEHSLADMHVAASGSNTVMTTADAGTITLVGVSASQISAADFTFS